MRIKKTYRFAIRSSIYILLFSIFTHLMLIYLIQNPNYLHYLGCSMLIGIYSFFVLQYRVERFIYKNIKKIYNDVSILDAATLTKKTITTDMATLTTQVKKFATNKKIEIDTLKLQEEFRRDYIGNISHELKTPLFTVQGYILTLLDGAMEDKQIRKKYLSRAQKGVDRLIYIVNELDTINKIETGNLNMNFRVFNIVDVVQNVFDILDIEANTKNIMLMFDMKYVMPIYVYADKDKIQQVLINLITNSIKYGVQNGTTEVSIEPITDNKVLIRIIDNGIGIEQKNISRIFERFYRVDKSGARKEGGSGLGLAIVKHIIEAHNERIYVESNLGKGSEFSFTLEMVTKQNQDS
ncbi:MAG: ATP-binding protein [Bacteroidota bacterium]|nr:ATP-binding protein [Bacteroidota bacterium]